MTDRVRQLWDAPVQGREARRDRILRLRDEGRTPAQIAHEMHSTAERVRVVLNQADSAPLTAPQKAEVEARAAAGQTPTEIAAALRLPYRPVELAYDAAKQRERKRLVKAGELTRPVIAAELPPPRPPMGMLPQDSLSWDDFLGAEPDDPPGEKPERQSRVRIPVVRAGARHNGRPMGYTVG